MDEKGSVGVLVETDLYIPDLYSSALYLLPFEILTSFLL